MYVPTMSVTGSPVTALPSQKQIQLILTWAKSCTSKIVCVANVHMLMEARWQAELGAVLREADLVAPDGMPLVWMLRLMGATAQDRLPGLDILTSICELAQMQEVGVYFLGSKADVLDSMRARLKQEFPKLHVAGMEPLPFRPLTASEDEELIQRVNASGAGVVFIALGCPKQEYWMAQHRNKIHAVMIGIGGAFPVYAGIHKRAPRWVRDCGLEWLYRLSQEPLRLWSRYAITIPPFLYLALKQLLIHKRLQPALSNQPQGK